MKKLSFIIINFFCFTIFFIPFQAKSQTAKNDYSPAQQNFYQSCVKRNLTNSIYDCQCLADQYHEAEDNIRKEGREREIKRYQTRGKQSLKINCEKGRKVYVAGGRVMPFPNEKNKNFERMKKNHGNPLDPCVLLQELEAGKLPKFKVSTGNIDITNVSTKLYKGISCRDEDKIYQTYYEEGKSTLNQPLYKIKTSKTEKEFCDCYAKEFVRELMKGAQMSSNFTKRMRSKTISKCK